MSLASRVAHFFSWSPSPDSAGRLHVREEHHGGGVHTTPVASNPAQRMEQEEGAQDVLEMSGRPPYLHVRSRLNPRRMLHVAFPPRMIRVSPRC